VRVGQLLLSFVLVFGMVACDGNSQPKASTWPVASISVQGGGHSTDLSVEIANTESRREQGLMYRQSLDDSHGMLFLFPGEVRDGFWMQNTYIPLDIAYVGADGRVLEIVHGKALDQTVLYPSQPYRYALEVADGWFARQGMGVGAILHLPADLPAAS
jgi:uncharacterized membrane protein (UPF0127 family)